jgi:hypothetical protein
MILEKGKVYKIKHYLFPDDGEFQRDYIIFSPMEDIVLADDFFCEKNIWVKYEGRSIFTLFTVCLSGTVIVEAEKEERNPHGYSSTGFDRFCKLLPLTDNDYNDIRKAIEMLGGEYIYNRKLNEIRKR